VNTITEMADYWRVLVKPRTAVQFALNPFRRREFADFAGCLDLQRGMVSVEAVGELRLAGVI
jgi:hypothetical protein